MTVVRLPFAEVHACPIEQFAGGASFAKVDSPRVAARGLIRTDRSAPIRRSPNRSSSMSENPSTFRSESTKLSHKDPITGTPGSHPVGVGLGAIGGGAAIGAAGGAVAGPIGAIAGAAVGAVVGGLVGKASAEEINPTVEGIFWRENYAARPYVINTSSYSEYEPAFRYGWESYGRYGGEDHSFASFEEELGLGWHTVKGSSKLAWHQAKDATRDAWNRIQQSAHARRKG